MSNVTSLTSPQRQALERLLKDNIARLRSEMTVALKSTGEADHLSLANHMAEVDDQAVADLQTALDIALIERDMRELRDSVRALERLRGAGYGICLDCGGAIAYSRLLANPSALRCVSCQEVIEKRDRQPTSL